jgi:hypothetical protein
MTTFKTCLLAAAAALSVMTSAGAATEMEQIRQWLSQLAPELDKMTAGLSAGPNLSTCEASGNVQECTQRKLDDFSARTAHMRLLSRSESSAEMPSQYGNEGPSDDRDDGDYA